MWRVDGRGRVYAHMLDTVKIYNPCGSAASVVHTGAIEERCVDNHARVCDSTNVACRRQRPCLRSYAHTLYVTTMVPSTRFHRFLFRPEIRTFEKENKKYTNSAQLGPMSVLFSQEDAELHGESESGLEVPRY